MRRNAALRAESPPPLPVLTPILVLPVLTPLLVLPVLTPLLVLPVPLPLPGPPVPLRRGAGAAGS